MAESDYCRYYADQCGKGLPYYQGAAYQRGHGLGNILKGAVRSVGAILGPTLKREGKNVALGVIGDVMQGRPLGISVKNRALRGVHSGAQRLLNSAIGGAAGRPIKRKAPAGKGRKSKARKKTGRRVKQKGSGDIFS